MHTSVARRACWLGLLFVTGCGSSDSFPIEGTVKLDGKPLAGVTVQFIAQDPGGRDANGTADAEGVFRLSTTRPGDGVLPGKYKVVIQPARASARPAASMADAQKSGGAPKPTAPPFPARYSRPDQTALVQDVPAPGPVVFDLRSN